MNDDPREIPTAALAALDYATMNADGTAEWMPEVEAAIDRGEPIKRVAALFNRTDAAASYLSQSIARRFAPAEAPDACEGCGGRATRLAMVSWTFKIRGRLLGVRKRYREADGSVMTHHPICRSCHARWARRIAPLRHAQSVMTYISLAATVALIGGWLAGKFGYRLPASWWWACIICIAVTLLVDRIAKAIEASAMPRAIKAKLPRWLAYQMLACVAGRRQFRE